MFERNGLLPAFDVVGLGLAVDLLELPVVGIEPRALHLLGHHVARKRDDADVVPRRGLHGDDVARFERKVVDVLIEGTARVLEAHLEYIGRNMIGIIGEPLRLMELEAPFADGRAALLSAVAEGGAAADLRSVFTIAGHSFVFYLQI